MCHLVLFMPLIALPIFWLMPAGYAVPIYIFVALLSAFLYWLITRAMKQPVRDDFRSLIGSEAEVTSVLGPADHARYLVRSAGELWSANCPETLIPGDKVRVAGVDGIKLLVKK